MRRLKFGAFLLVTFMIWVYDSCQTPSLLRRPSSDNSAQLYTQDIQGERESQYTEIVLIPPQIQNLNYTHLIFNETLSKDFKRQYQERFQTQWQQSEITLQEMFTAYNSRVVLESQRRREFAEYVMKRLTEYHVDQYIQSDPSMRTLYEVKEKLQKVEVKVNQQTKLNMNYSLSGNILEIKFENPYFEESKITYRMDPRSFGPTSPLLTEYRVTKSITSDKKLQTLYEEQIKSWSFFLLHSLSPQLNTFYGLNVTTQPISPSSLIDPITNQPLLRAQDPLRVQAGFGWAF